MHDKNILNDISGGNILHIENETRLPNETIDGWNSIENNIL